MLKTRRCVPGRLADAGKALFEKLESRQYLAGVAVNLGQEFQTMESIGGSYPMALYTNQGQNNQGRFTLDQLKPEYVRTIIPINFWEPSNDNADPNSVNAGGFNDTGKVNEVFRMMQDMKARGIKITASVWDGPSWMLTDTELRDKHKLPVANEPEMIESITAFVLRAKNTYGVTIDTLSFNESNGGYKILLPADQHNRIVKGVQAKLAAGGITSTKWLAGDTYAVWDTIDYTRQMLADPDARQHFAAVSYHSWWSEAEPRATWEGINNLAKQYGLPVWAGEVGYHGNAQGWDPWESWSNAERIAKTYHQIIGWSQASVTMHWSYQDTHPIVSPNLTPYPSFYVLKQLGEIWTKGTKVVGAASDDSGVWTLAGKNTAANRFVAQAINTTTGTKSTTFTGLPNKPLTLKRTTGTATSVTEGAATIGTYTPVNGRLTLNLAPDSFNTLSGELGTVTNPPPPDNRPPTVGSLSATPNPVAAGGTLNLTANNVNDPDGHPLSVGFFRESNGQPGLQGGAGGDALLAADETAADGYTAAVSTSGLAVGTHTFYAQALETTKSFAPVQLTSNVVSAQVTVQNAPPGNAPPSIGSLSASPNPVTAGNALTLTANNVSDPDSAIEVVQFFRETNGAAGLQPGAGGDAQAGADASSAGGYAATVGTTGLSGALTFYAQAVDQASGQRGNVVSAQVSVQAANPGTNVVTVEAESGQVVGAVVARQHPNYTGTGYVDFNAASGESVQWTANSASVANRAFTFRYANGGTTDRPLQVSVNGQVVGNTSFRPTGGFGAWNTTTFNLTLAAGANTIKLTSIGQSGPNIDHFKYDAGGTTQPPPPPPPPPSQDNGTYQAEDQQLSGAIKQTVNPGYTGSGFADYIENAGGFVQWNSFYSAGSAERVIQFRYANGGTTARRLSVQVNGGPAVTLSFAPTGSWTTWRTLNVNALLNGGNNVIRATSVGDNGPNLDSLTLLPGIAPPPPPAAADLAGRGRRGRRRRQDDRGRRVHRQRLRRLQRQRQRVRRVLRQRHHRRPADAPLPLRQQRHHPPHDEPDGQRRQRRRRQLRPDRRRRRLADDRRPGQPADRHGQAPPDHRQHRRPERRQPDDHLTVPRLTDAPTNEPGPGTHHAFPAPFSFPAVASS